MIVLLALKRTLLKNGMDTLSAKHETNKPLSDLAEPSGSGKNFLHLLIILNAFSLGRFM